MMEKKSQIVDLASNEIDKKRNAYVAPLPMWLEGLIQSVGDVNERSFIRSIEKNAVFELPSIEIVGSISRHWAV